MKTARNVIGGDLKTCSDQPKTGFFRNGVCEARPLDAGAHVVCTRVTRKFFDFSASRGNDLRPPRPELGFPGLSPGDLWCLCALRCKEALDAGVAPPVILAATHESVLRHATLEDLRRHALDERSYGG